MTNAERQRKWIAKNRALHNLRRRNKRKNLPVPVLAEPDTDRVLRHEKGSEARESNKAITPLPMSHGCDEALDSRGGQTPFETKKVGEFRMLVIPEMPKEEPTMPVVKPKVFFNDHGAQISEKVWNTLQEKKRKALESGYEFDPQ